MKFKILDRITIQNILPTEGNFDTLVIKDDILKKAAITQDEIKKFDIKTAGGSITWSKEGVDYELDIDFSELETNLIKDQLAELDKQKKLNDNTIRLYKQFK